MLVGALSIPSSASFPARVCAVYTSQRQTYRKPTSMSTVSASIPCLYEALGISVAATGQEIKAAYRKLARACHPDVVAVDRKDESADKFMRINLAYSTLSDPNKRADYDRRSFGKQRVSHGPSTAYSSVSTFGKRTWETDQCWWNQICFFFFDRLVN